jgi:nonsense-mediated mRNA decay protein 3
MKVRCPKCGKWTDKLINGVCEDCQEIKIHKKSDGLEICKRCGKIKHKGVFKKISIEDALKQLYKEKIKNVKNLEFKDNYYILFEFEFEGKKFKDSAHIKYVVCPDCMRQSSNYYEAIIQIRSNDFEDLCNFIAEYVEKHNNEPRCFITKLDLRKEGIDIYLGSKKIANKIIRELKKRNKYIIKESYSLWGQNKEKKEIYRTTYCIKDKEKHN